eukprot:SAG31_NODE_1593_length_7811_cov_13.037215_4_plen_78_part_00
MWRCAVATAGLSRAHGGTVWDGKSDLSAAGSDAAEAGNVSSVRNRVAAYDSLDRRSRVPRRRACANTPNSCGLVPTY